MRFFTRKNVVLSKSYKCNLFCILYYITKVVVADLKMGEWDRIFKYLLRHGVAFGRLEPSRYCDPLQIPRRNIAFRRKGNTHKAIYKCCTEMNTNSMVWSQARPDLYVRVAQSKI